MSFLRGTNRSEVQLLPPCLGDHVPANAPARFNDAYVEGLDFAALGFTRALPEDTGRPPYHPAILLKLHLYGYPHSVRARVLTAAGASRSSPPSFPPTQDCAVCGEPCRTQICQLHLP